MIMPCVLLLLECVQSLNKYLCKIAKFSLQLHCSCADVPTKFIQN
jgi:hypothetical protein